MSEDFVLPQLRDDIKTEVIEDQGEKLVVLSDPDGLAQQPIAIPLELAPVFHFLNGSVTMSELKSHVKTPDGSEPDMSPIVQMINYLDAMGYIKSPEYMELRRKYDEYLASPVRKPVCAGQSYSSDPNQLREQLGDILHSVNGEDINPGAKSIIVPHIDFLIGKEAHETYAAGYQALKGTDPDLFVIFGTAHYRYSDYLMFTEKDFETPLGAAKTDKEVLEQLKEELPFDLKFDDTAHFKEHSVELQVVLLQRMFEGKDFTILPILIGSFQEFIESGVSPTENTKFKKYIDSLKTAIEKSGRKPAYIASVDFGHIGRRFGNDFNAEDKLEELKAADRELIDNISAGDKEAFFKKIADCKNQWNVCGVSPIYALMQTTNPKKSQFLTYNQWNDSPTYSAVSFASMAIYE